MKLTRLEPRIAKLNTLIGASSSSRPNLSANSVAHLRLRGANAQRRNAKIRARDEHSCKVCDRVVLAGEGQVDHIIPLEQGGSDKETNLQLLCDECHAAKTKAEAQARAGR